MSIEKQTLHPEDDINVDIYPKTSKDQVVGLEDDLSNCVKNEDVSVTSSPNTIVKRGSSGTIACTRAQVGTQAVNKEQMEEYVEEHSGGSMETVDTIINIDDGFKITYANGNHLDLPLKAGQGISMDVSEDNYSIEIKAEGGGTKLYKHNLYITDIPYLFELGGDVLTSKSGNLTAEELPNTFYRLFAYNAGSPKHIRSISYMDDILYFSFDDDTQQSFASNQIRIQSLSITEL